MAAGVAQAPPPGSIRISAPAPEASRHHLSLGAAGEDRRHHGAGRDGDVGAQPHPGAAHRPSRPRRTLEARKLTPDHAFSPSRVATLAEHGTQPSSTSHATSFAGRLRREAAPAGLARPFDGAPGQGETRGATGASVPACGSRNGDRHCVAALAVAHAVIRDGDNDVRAGLARRVPRTGEGRGGRIGCLDDTVDLEGDVVE